MFRWTEVGIAYGGSDAAGLADTLVTDLGLTGLPFTNVKNGCATGGSALAGAAFAVRAGAADLALAVGFDEHPPGAFDPRPEEWGLPTAYGSEGLMVTTQFFGAKIARYLHDHEMSRACSAPWPRRPTATAPATRRRGGGWSARPRRSWPHRWSTTRSPS